MWQRGSISAIINAGLGNQMFQYAAARRLAYVTKRKLLLLRIGEDGPEGHSIYGLNRFNIAGSELAFAQQHMAAKFRLDGHITLRMWPPTLVTGRLVREASIWDYRDASDAGILKSDGNLLFRPEILTERKPVRLLGFWQDERYFKDAADLIKADFTLRAELDEQSLDCLARIKSRPSAFLHVRRGDYLTPVFAEYFGTCTAEYYHQGVEILRQRHGDELQIFVFGNDFEWIRENQIGGEAAMIVDWNITAPERDLMLMRACQHAVIANSSFSWWGAWLGDWPGQTVIAPRIWFKAVPEFCDIIPARWIRL